jgi:uncharacterized phage protein gp47/JayE
MTMNANEDLTRWNRAGLSRFDYIDGNAAVFLERLRRALAARFPGWQPVPAPPADVGASATYAADPDDMLWQLTRQFARACHVLAVHLDADANEAFIGTASQWDNLRRLTALIDYAPQPPASASAPLALLLKDGKSGSVAAGLQIKYAPPDGAPLVFETLGELLADARYNTLHARDHRRNPQPLSGGTLRLEGRHDKLKSGDPLVLEDERHGALSAHLVQGISVEDAGPDGHTRVALTPPIPAGYTKGWTRVHLAAKDRLAVLGPATDGVAHVGHSLQLAVGTGDLAAGDIVVVRSADDKPYYRRIKSVRDKRLVFYRAIDQLTLSGASVARAVSVPLADLADPPRRRVIEEDGSVIDVVHAAGDWSRLAGQWLAHIRKINARRSGAGDAAAESGGNTEREYLPAYRCLHAKYVPVRKYAARLAEDERPGFTALTLVWNAQTDGVGGDLDLRLNNPQTLLAPPPTAGAYLVDRFLNKSADGRLTADLATALAKQTCAGDLAVLAMGAQLAWARLANVELHMEHGESTLTAQGYWADRGGGPFFLARSTLHGHFTQQARVVGWQDNTSPLAGRRVLLETLPTGLKTGRALIVDGGSTALETKIAALDQAAGWIELADPLPAGSRAGTLRIHANVLRAGHGETRLARVLGSGDATRDSQRFTLTGVAPAFVADATMRAGVRAALEINVAGEVWTQVSTLKDSGASDAHYQVRLDEDGDAQIEFGDGRHGRRLPSGANNVRVAFREGAGVAGNVAAGCLTKLLKPHPLIDALVQPIAASGGADRESVADLRDNAPATLLTLERAVSLDDFAQLARAHASVWQAQAFRRAPGLGQRERIDVVVMAAGGGAPSPALKVELRDTLRAHALPGVAINVSDYQRVTFRLRVTIRVRSAAFDRQGVRDTLAGTLRAAFNEQSRRLGAPLFRGAVYAAVDAVAGVDNSDCHIDIDAASRALLARVVVRAGEVMLAQPSAGQCLVLDAEHLSIVVEESRP